MRLAVPLLALALAGCGRSEPSPPGNAPAAPVQAGPGILALLDIQPDQAVGPVQVASIEGIRKGVIHVQVKKGDARGELVIALLSADGPLPPVKTAKYGVFHSSPRPGTPAIAPSELMAAAEALAERIRATEGKVAVPAGLASYHAEQGT